MPPRAISNALPKEMVALFPWVEDAARRAEVARREEVARRAAGAITKTGTPFSWLVL
jgi:hypothetical protein